LSLLTVTKEVLREQDTMFTENPEQFEAWVQENLGVTEPELRGACLDSDAGTADDGEPIGPVVDVTPQAAFLAGLVVGRRGWDG
jgi:hypothetical protein